MRTVKMKQTNLIGLSLALMLVPSLVLSWDMTWDQHVFHMVALFSLAVAAVLLGMALRRKVYLASGVIAVVAEGLLKLYHFKLKYDVTDWVWLLLVGLVIIVLVLYLETKRNKQLRARADEAKARLAQLFEGWE